MTTRALSYPARLSESLRWQLPDHPHVRVTPKDADEHTCAVYAADHYEVGVFYAAATVGLEALGRRSPRSPGCIGPPESWTG